MARTKDPDNERSRREAMMAATYGLLVARPWHQVTLADVAASAGVSKGLPRYYFGNQERLIVDTIRWFLKRQVTGLHAIAGLDIPVQQRLQMLIDAALPDYEVLDAEVRFQLEVWSFAKKSRPDVLVEIRAAYADFRGTCAELVTVGIQEGYVTDDVDPMTYVFIHSLLDGLSIQATIDTSLDIPALRARTRAVIEKLLN